MGTQRMSLLNRLCSIINHDEPGSSNYVVAEYLLQHYQDMVDLNIYDVAEACYSSRSSIRRFAQAIGYDNFKEMKEQFPTYGDWRSEHFSMAKDYDRALEAGIQEVIGGICRRVTEGADTRELVRAIHDSPLPMFYCTGMSLSLAQELQREMIYNRKLVFASPDLELCRRQMEAAEGEGLLIVVTVTGNFAQQSLEELDRIQAKKILLIAGNGERFQGHFDMIYSLEPEEISQPADADLILSHLSILGRYGLAGFFDLLFWSYMREYG